MTGSADLVSMDEADELLRRLDDCWTSVIRKIDESSIESVWEMVDRLRPHILQGASLGERWHLQGIESFTLYLENSAGLFSAFVTALGYAAELRVLVENGPVRRTSKVALGAFQMVDEAWNRILGADRQKRVEKAKRGGIARGAIQHSVEKAFVLQQLRAHRGIWKTIAAAADAIDGLFEEAGPVSDFSNRVVRIRRWISEDPELRAAYEDGRRH